MTEQDQTLTNLLASAVNAREQDGARLARILHDEVGQVLSAIGLQLDLLRMDLDENVEGAVARIADVQRVLEGAVTQVRELSYQLNPSIVERTGLQFALDRLVGRYRKDFHGSIRLLFDPAVRVPVVAASALYKIAEQALDNAVRHADAGQIEVIAKVARQQVVLEIRDNGGGLPPGVDPQGGGLGLFLMRHHADRGGLAFSVASAAEKGTIVRAIFRNAEGNSTAGGSGPCSPRVSNP